MHHRIFLRWIGAVVFLFSAWFFIAAPLVAERHDARARSSLERWFEERADAEEIRISARTPEEVYEAFRNALQREDYADAVRYIVPARRQTLGDQFAAGDALFLPPVDALTFEEETTTRVRFSYDRPSEGERFVFAGGEHVFPAGIYTQDIIFLRVHDQWFLDIF